MRGAARCTMEALLSAVFLAGSIQIFGFVGSFHGRWWWWGADAPPKGSGSGVEGPPNFSNLFAPHMYFSCVHIHTRTLRPILEQAELLGFLSLSAAGN